MSRIRISALTDLADPAILAALGLEPVAPRKPRPMPEPKVRRSASHNVPMGKPADWPWRLLPDDIRLMAVEAAETECSFVEAPFLGDVSKGRLDRAADALGLDRARALEALVQKWQRAIKASLPKEVRTSKKRKAPAQRARWEAPCSGVVITTRRGESWSGGHCLSDEERAEVLAIPGEGS